MAEIEELSDDIVGVALVNITICEKYLEQPWIRPSTEEEKRLLDNWLHADKIVHLLRDRKGRTFKVMTFLEHPDLPQKLADEARSRGRIFYE